ncbi:ARS-binding protein 1 [Penicillium malachiteum]|uniref:ARS-binding protein 1 n=1 Tax=Penicillium malachiteum TaxID=1324776 RepID=UPI0025484D99|nr:ARS-binding protein 1 [Penicillium malachiteum]KAJ5721893.1 ARS-binding protein 1 [Penicillium malachiteum]
MKEWLYWFDQRMTGRKIVLLMDNFSAHEAAADLIKHSQIPLQNTLIIWLPPNTTSKYQPLDQGIINTWKVYWRREWVRYMLWEYEARRDPLATVDILKAIRWAIKAWEFDINALVITNCFRKGLYDSKDQVDTPLVHQDISRDIERLPIRDVMDISQFLNPVDEEVIDSHDTIEELILSQFQGPKTQDIEEEDTGQEIEMQPPITLPVALSAIRDLISFHEQQETPDVAYIRGLRRDEIEMQRKEVENRKQSDIRGYFHVNRR